MLIKPFIIPIFIPHIGCPHQCVFCNQSIITSSGITSSGITSSGITSSGIISRNETILDNFNISSDVQKYLTYKGNRKKVQIAFYGGTFLGLDKYHIKRLLTEATKFVKKGLVDSIRFSTRPDTITEETIALLQGFPVETIELGVQSMDNSVLILSGRGHTAYDTEKAINLLKKKTDYKIGLQMMVGLPGDSKEKSIATGNKIASFFPSFVRIYPTVVFTGSPLAILYKKGSYLPIKMDDAVSLVAKLYLLFKQKNITVIRMGLQASSDFNKDLLIAGPYHPAFGHLVFSKIFLDTAITIIEKTISTETYNINKQQSIVIHVNPSSISEMRGIKNSNTNTIKKKYGFRKVDITPDSKLLKNNISIFIYSV